MSVKSNDIEDEIPITTISAKFVEIKCEELDSYSTEDMHYKNGDSNLDDNEMNDPEENVYNCESCGVTLTSIDDHVRDFHEGQDIVVQVEESPSENSIDFVSENNIKIETDDDLIIEEKDEDIYEVEYLYDEDLIYAEDDEVAPKILGNKIMPQIKKETIRVEQCLDMEGREYNKKTVKIEKFWSDQETVEMVKCDKCHTIYVEDSLKSHICSDKSKPKQGAKLGNYICRFCDIVSTTAREYSSHMKIHNSNKKTNEPNIVEAKTALEHYECEVCQTVFPTNKSLRLHFRMHDPIKSKPIAESFDYVNVKSNGTITHTPREFFLCDICNKSYEKQFEVIHMKMHSNDPNYHCSICNKKFNSELNLEMHIKAHQEAKPARSKSAGIPNLDLPYKCKYCDRQFSRPHEKVKHERIHTGEKPHICEICGKCFRVAYCLTLHMRTHTGARPYVCPHCNKRFKAHSVYNHHLMTHSDQRPYQCTFCPKAFKTSVQLAGHKNSHTKPFSCTECNRPFASLYAVRAHMETHKKLTNNLKHKCVICGATYARSFALRDHIKEHHSAIYEMSDGIDIMSVGINVDDQMQIEEQVLAAEQSILMKDKKDESEETIIGELEHEEVVGDWVIGC